jgi:hypothetical protein
MASEGTTKNLMKPWQGPLPRPRISPPKTLGDVVIKNYVEQLRSGRLVDKSFKMALPPTMDSPVVNLIKETSRDSHEQTNLWPPLPEIKLVQSLMMTSISGNDNMRSTISGIQESFLMGQSKVMPSPIPKHIQVANKSYRAWFYPSKGLNELFSRAGTVPNTSGIKPAAAPY